MDNGAELYRGFLGGNKDDLTELIRMYRDGLTIYINSIVGNIDLAEDIMEDTFVKLYVKKPRFSGKSSFKTWLYSIGHHTAIDRMRKESRHSELPLNDVMETADKISLEKSYIKKEEQLMLHRNISRLNPDYRQILYLIFFEGFTNSEAANIMKRSDKQIRDLLCNAKKALKIELERSGFTYEGI